MTISSEQLPRGLEDEFRHEALFYDGDAGFLDGTVPFIRDGVEAGEPVFVVVGARKIEMLRSALGSDATRVRFADMADVGRNPARIIPAWRDFLMERAEGERVRGIGEPIWAGRSSDELVECHRHEALLNLAFESTSSWWLLCPYDVSTLAPEVVEEAHRTHPYVARNGTWHSSDRYHPLTSSSPFDAPLPAPPADAVVQEFDIETLRRVRATVARFTAEHQMEPARANDLVLAVNEAATNSLRHGGGRGTLRLWRDGAALVSEISDEGQIVRAMIGRERPERPQEGGYGLWLVNQLCDLVQVRTFAFGSVVRIHMALEPA